MLDTFRVPEEVVEYLMAQSLVGMQALIAEHPPDAVAKWNKTIQPIND